MMLYGSSKSLFSYTVCTDGDVLPLIGGSTAREGFVEVCVGGVFLPVSLRSFTVTEANVLCRQLNLGTGRL